MIIEVDGGQHNEELEKNKDNGRTAWLEEHGFKVIRYWNDDVLMDTNLVLDSIISEIGKDVPSS